MEGANFFSIDKLFYSINHVNDSSVWCRHWLFYEKGPAPRNTKVDGYTILEDNRKRLP